MQSERAATAVVLQEKKDQHLGWDGATEKWLPRRSIPLLRSTLFQHNRPAVRWLLAAPHRQPL